VLTDDNGWSRGYGESCRRREIKAITL